MRFMCTANLHMNSKIGESLREMQCKKKQFYKSSVELAIAYVPTYKIYDKI